jgi:hypothetical protein
LSIPVDPDPTSGFTRTRATLTVSTPAITTE